MKKFIRKILLFSLIPVIIFSVFLIWYSWSLKNIVLTPEPVTIICGDSHTQSSINDSILSNAINLSQSSEHFLYTYNVLQLTLQNNPSIERVILGVSYHSFGKGYDRYICGDKSQYMYPKYIPIFQQKSLNLIYKCNSSELIAQFPQIFKNALRISFLPISNNLYPFYGAFYKSSRSELNDSTIIKAIKRHYYNKDGTIQDYSSIQEEYLNKIVSLCNDNNVELVLINTPINDAYKRLIPNKFIVHYYNVISNLKGSVKFWDYNNLELDKICYGDGDHLNFLGAKILTSLIKKRLENKVRTHNNVYKSLDDK